MEEKEPGLRTQWWPEVERAFREMESKTDGFMSREKLRTDDVITDNYKLMALRLISGYSREQVAAYLSCTVPDLTRWEEGTSRIPMEYGQARTLIIRADLAAFRKNPSSIISRFFQECSSSQMREDVARNRRSLRDWRIGTVTLPLSFVILFLGVILAWNVGTVSAGIFAGLSFLLVLAVSTAYISQAMDALGVPSTVAEELTYAGRLLESPEEESKKLSAWLLDQATLEIENKIQTPSDLSDRERIYRDIVDAFQSRLIPGVQNFESLTDRQREVCLSAIAGFAEHFFASTMASALSLNDVLKELKKEIAESHMRLEEESILQKISRSLGEKTATPTGQHILETILVILVMLLVTIFFWWFFNRPDISVTVTLFAGLLGVYGGPRIVLIMWSDSATRSRRKQQGAQDIQQVVQDVRQVADKWHRLDKLKKEVFKRWLHVFATRDQEGNSEFLIPDPPDEKHTTTGLPLTDIPEFTLAESWLNDNRPDVILLWSKAEDLLDAEDEARRQHWAAVGKAVKRNMKLVFPSLNPQMSRHELQVNFYNLDTITDRVFQRSYSWIKNPRNVSKFTLNLSTEEGSNGETIWQVGNSQVHLAADSQKAPDVEKYEELLVATSKDDDVTDAGRKYIITEGKFREALQRFKTELEKVTVAIDYRNL